MIFVLETLIASFTPALLLLAILCLIHHRRTLALRRRCMPDEWTPDLPLDRYRPMFRLLDPAEFRYLRAQPGATTALVSRFRRQRCELFRQYLGSMQRDFRAASKLLMVLIVQSPSDRRDLLGAWISSQVRFTLGLYRVRCRLAFYEWNLGYEPVAQLVSLFENLQLELLALTPATATPRPF